MIRMHFPNAADSPTLRTPVRVRYALERQGDGRTVPVLRYAHGTMTLTPGAWAGFQAAGASITASSPREAQVLREALGSSACVAIEREPQP